MWRVEDKSMYLALSSIFMSLPGNELRCTIKWQVLWPAEHLTGLLGFFIFPSVKLKCWLQSLSSFKSPMN